MRACHVRIYILKGSIFVFLPNYEIFNFRDFSWVGIHKSKNGWGWQDCFPPCVKPTWEEWGSGQPNGNTDKCALLSRTTGDLYDYTCTGFYPYICRRTIGKMFDTG